MHNRLIFSVPAIPAASRLARRARAACLLVAVLCNSPLSAVSSDQPAALRGAEGVLERLVHDRAKEFHLTVIPRENGRDVFDIQAANGSVVIGGSNASSLCRGIYHYLRHACHGQVAWSGTHIDLPASLPDFPRTKITTPYEHRQYFNVCTFGYTTVWWNWERWEKEIDWMALHGINMPLAMAGQEAVWERVWKSMGLTDADLAGYFTGPAFLPWHRMGNVNGHGGPLPHAWINEQASLQKKILARMRELGMDPVVPAFSGFVPVALKRLHPEATIYDLAAWGDFPVEERTHIISPNSSLFQEIGRRFVTEERAMFGPLHYYLADSFNELQVPVTREGRYDELAAFGSAVYSSIIAGDSDGVWVMQGWLFHNDRSFWDQPSVRALLRRVPDDRMIILDLANEQFHGWQVHDGFYGKRWIYSTIHNFGGNNPLSGDLSFIATDPAVAAASPRRGRLCGIGLAPEGIENNDVVYELSTDMFWSERPAELQEWLEGYAQSRYGACPPAMKRAWQLLAVSAYAHGGMNFKHGFQQRPSAAPEGNVDVSPQFRQAVDLFLSCSTSLEHSPLYVADAVELTAQVLGGAVDSRLRDALRAHASAMPAVRDTLVSQAISLMRIIDALLSTRPDRRLERWIDDARRWGTAQSHSGVDTGDSAFYEWNARLQITLWGGPDLYDYASKMWSGLVRDFYAGRWEKYFDILRTLPPHGIVPVDSIITWEEAWTRRTGLSAPLAVIDPLREAKAEIADVHRPSFLTPAPVMTPERPVLDDARPTDVFVATPDTTAAIHYTLDGSMPDRSSPVTSGRIALTGDAVVSARAFRNSGIPSFVTTRRYSVIKRGVNGLRYAYYEGTWTSLPDFDTCTVVRKGIAYSFDLAELSPREDYFGARYEGEMEIRQEGEYTFLLGSDDGSRFVIDGATVVENDGLHSFIRKNGTVRLGVGRHRIVVDFFENAGGERLDLLYEGPGIVRQSIPASQLFCGQ